MAVSHYLGGSVNSKAVLEEFSRLKEQIAPSVELVARDPGNYFAIIKEILSIKLKESKILKKGILVIILAL